LHIAINFILAGIVFVAALFWFGCIPNRWYQILQVASGSMQPVINAGDFILVTSSHNRPKAGDILTFAVDGKLVTHRLEKINPDGSWMTQGDWNSVPDDLSDLDIDLIGIYRLTIPFGKHLEFLSMFMQPQLTEAWFLDHETIGFHLSVETKEDNPKGTSISAEVTAAGIKDTAANLAWVNGQVCVKNDGEVKTSALQVIAQVQYKTDNGFQPLNESFVIEVADQLKAGETGCYDYEATFTPVETNQYLLAAAVSITNHSGWLPGGNHCPGLDVCPYGPDVNVSFDLSEKVPTEEVWTPTAPIATVAPTPTATIEPLPTATIEPSPTATIEPTPTTPIEPTPTTPIEPTPTTPIEPTPTTPIEPTPTTPIEPTPTTPIEPTPTTPIEPTPTTPIEPTPTTPIEPTPTTPIKPTPTTPIEPTPTTPIEPTQPLPDVSSGLAEH
jgi:signal peptidase I